MSLLLLLGGEGEGEPAPEPVEPLNVLRYPVQTQGKCTIRLLALDGAWETVGADRCRGVRHEALSASANRKGSDTCRFTLKRQPGGVFPDLTAATPIEIINPFGTLVWAGRIKETPSSDGDDFSIGVEGEGWQYHLYDDVFERTYVHARLTDWKDSRSFLEAPRILPGFFEAGSVSAGDGVVTIGVPKGQEWPSTGMAGVTLDLGPDGPHAKRIVLTAKRGPGAPTTIDLMWSVASAGPEAAVVDFGTLDANIAASMSQDGTVYAATITTPGRYLTIHLRNNGSTYTTGADDIVTLTKVLVATDTAYEAGNGSVFRAHHGISDALAFAPLLSQDTSLITPTLFDIPDFSMTDERKPGEAMEALNALHNYILKVRTDMRLEFRPLPTVPLFRVGPWSGADFKDASKNSLEDIYNRSIVKGTGHDGQPCKVDRRASVPTTVGAPQPTNPSAATDTTGWTGDVSRTTSVFDTSPASFRLNYGGEGGEGTQLSSMTQTIGGFQPGLRYRLRARARGADITLQGGAMVYTALADGFSVAEAYLENPTSEAWTDLMVEWVQPSTTTQADIFFQAVGEFSDFGSPPVMYIDSMAIEYMPVPTLADRRGFLRSHVHSMSQAITPEIGQQIADTFLATHKRTPLKGAITVKGRGGVRRFLGDASVPPSELLIHTGELVHLADQIDPDSGALGRDAPIDTVTWSEDDDDASVSLDSQRDNLAALLARYDLVAGGR